MTPLKGTDKDTKIIKIERFPYKKLDKNKVQHIAGGPYKGIIVHKAMTGKYNYTLVRWHMKKVTWEKLTPSSES